MTGEHRAPQIWGRQEREAAPSPGRALSGRARFVYVWPWLERRSGVAKYSSDAVIRVQPGWGIYFLQRLRGERAGNRRGNAGAVR